MHIGRTLKTFHTLLRVTPALDVSMMSQVAEHRNILSGLVAYYQGQKKMNGRKWKLLFLKK